MFPSIKWKACNETTVPAEHFLDQNVTSLNVWNPPSDIRERLDELDPDFLRRDGPLSPEDNSLQQIFVCNQI